MRCFFIAVLAGLAGVHPADAQGQRFLRVSGPAATKITAFRPDGTLVWSNALTDQQYTIQTVTSLPGGTNWVDYLQLDVTTRVNTNRLFDFNPPAGMMLVPAGVFGIGDTLDGEYDAVPTNVTVSAFYMDVNLVSRSQWQTVYAYAMSHGYGFDNAGAGTAVNHPVQTVNWYDVVKWSNARSTQAGLTPVYYTDAGLTQVYTNGEVDAVYANWTNNGYRLPTEAEWEKAARGGLSGLRFPWGNTIDWSHANYYSLWSAGTASYLYDYAPVSGYNPAFNNTSPVGSFAANGYGIYDLAGNVEEWCWDWYDDNLALEGCPYAGGTDPRGPAASTYGLRVVRGGVWNDAANLARCASRENDFDPHSAAGGIGFRCVRRH